MAIRWFSLRRRLSFWLLGAVAAGWLAAVGLAFVELRHEVEEFIEKQDVKGEAARELDAELREHFVGALLHPLLFGLPLLGGVLWLAVWRGLRPIEALAAEIGARAPERLDALTPAAAPRELKPLIEAMNGLFGRIAVLLEQERRFTADAAHELRTPLAAIATQAQVAQRSRDAVELQQALTQIVAGSERASRLVGQLLTLARLDPAAEIPLAEVQLDRLAAEVCADHGALALEKNITLALDAPQPVAVRGHADLLRVLLRNLVDNALRYTPPGGEVDVKVSVVGTAVRIVVSDNGPGIPPAERENVLRRFYRLAGQEIAGSGLGLPIVARIAELHGARLELGEGAAGRGLCVRVTLRRFSPAPESRAGK